MTLAGAEKIAAAIRVYWAHQGHAVKVWVHAERNRAGKSEVGKFIYEVKTDMVNGLPRDWKGNGKKDLQDIARRQARFQQDLD